MSFLTDFLINGAGSVISSLSSIGSTKRQTKQQKDLMTYQDQINDENYEKSLADQRQLIAEDREYNSIGSQMQRAREANVSPLAALGVSSGNSVSASSPSHSGVSIPSPVGDSLSNVGASLSNIGSVLADLDLKKEQLRGQKIENDNKQREYDDKHWRNVADIDLIRESITTQENQRRIADAQLTLQREQFDLEKDMQGDANQRAWLDAYREQERFLLDSAYLAFRNEKMREQWTLEANKLKANTDQMLASAKSLLDSLEIEKNKLSFEEQKELQRIQENWRDYDEKVRQFDDKLNYERSRDAEDRKTKEYVAELQVAVQAATKVVEEVIEPIKRAFGKSIPTVTTTQTTKRGGTTFSRTVTEHGTK